VFFLLWVHHIAPPGCLPYRLRMTCVTNGKIP
jgi:hypothetical protein